MCKKYREHRKGKRQNPNGISAEAQNALVLSPGRCEQLQRTAQGKPWPINTRRDPLRKMNHQEEEHEGEEESAEGAGPGKAEPSTCSLLIKCWCSVDVRHYVQSVLNINATKCPALHSDLVHLTFPVLLSYNLTSFSDVLECCKNILCALCHEEGWSVCQQR